ncbi:5-hydroxytryptamine receptor 2A-like [Paramacrobiotus metropolitanus]|uniref:5-hydroxytryptamine receptor 2A-like n=1 Tax=Paramacrobiotus metropolitanus TaxID=2943436 RepID=UPI002445BB6D|nr:5-hydroxytryptamine receptor 2A-like [Paramacrobiotus metropolitanus]
MNNTSGNISAALPTAHWSPAPTFTLVVFCTALTFNLTVLAVFLFRRSLRGAFQLYIQHLLVVNIVYLLLQNPLDVLHNLYAARWRWGYTACTVYLYANHVSEALVIHAHMLITVNRVWAVAAPIHYRHHHRPWVAAVLCGCALIWVHICLLPGVVLDALFYRLSIELHGCELNGGKQKSWFLIATFLNYNIPIAVMLLAYPFICYKRWQREHAGNAVRPVPAITVQSSDTHSLSSVKIPPLQRSRSHPPRGRTHSFVLLSLLTCSVAVNWIPIQVYYTAILFTDADLSRLFHVGTVLWSLQAALDPLYFTVVFTDIRRVFATVSAAFKRL